MAKESVKEETVSILPGSSIVLVTVKNVYASSVREVKKKLLQAKAADIEKKNVVKPNIRLDEWYKKWMEVYKRPVVRANTIRHYQYVYEHNIVPYIGNPKITEITKLAVQDVFEQIEGRWLSMGIYKQGKIVVDRYV